MEVPLFETALMRKISFVEVHCYGMDLFDMRFVFILLKRGRIVCDC